MGPEDFGRALGIYVAGIIVAVFAVTSLFWWIVR